MKLLTGIVLGRAPQLPPCSHADTMRVHNHTHKPYVYFDTTRRYSWIEQCIACGDLLHRWEMWWLARPMAVSVSLYDITAD